MTTRQIVKAFLKVYFRGVDVKYVSIKEITKDMKWVRDAYRIVYGLGLNDPEFAIEKDEESTYIRMVVV